MADYNPQPFVSNPMSSFDPTQWSNPYSLFKGQALPWPSQYAGPPTDAFGQPIQSYVNANNAAQANYQQQLAAYNAKPPAAAATPGTTLNSVPGGGSGRQSLNQVTAAAQAAGGGWAATDPSTGQTYAQERAMTPEAQFNAVNAQMGSPAAPMGGGGVSHDQMGSYNAIGQLNANQYMTGVQQEQPTAAPAAASSAPTPPNMSAAYLSAMANPGPLRPVGANVPLSAAQTQPGPGVLQQFLANWQPQGGSGPGSQFTQSFSNALRGRA